ncbi:MAG: DUF2695 domain-containing protein [Acidobacteria bacterium]|nr:DUF2695 domain-containing protein [Acidobacteriota bacterium]MBK8146744.1 DUF2695 domain-containing protein [Acidobacteriota bacterium]MBK8812988.1 DUF2695 domain-containing protein [Acidobacteriota bacterium]
MAILRKRQIENLAQLSGEELEEFLKSLPAGQFDFEDLFDFLEFKLENEECNHSLRFAMQFMMENRLNFPRVSSWLQENGGFCDCKVLEQIVPAWRKAFD